MAIQVTENQAEKILLYRKRNRLSQVEMGKLCDVSDGTIKTLEKKGSVSLESLQKVMSIVDKDIPKLETATTLETRIELLERKVLEQDKKIHQLEQRINYYHEPEIVKVADKTEKYKK